MIYDSGAPELGAVEIPSLEVDDSSGEDYVKVESLEDFDLLVKAMGFKDTADFETDTGVSAEELIGQFWMTMGDHFIGHNRVYLKMDEKQD